MYPLLCIHIRSANNIFKNICHNANIVFVTNSSYTFVTNQQYIHVCNYYEYNICALCSCCVHTICFVYLHVSCQPQVGACVPATMSAQKIRPCNPEWNCCLLSREFHAWAKTPLIRRRGYGIPPAKACYHAKTRVGKGSCRRSGKSKFAL